MVYQQARIATVHYVMLHSATESSIIGYIIERKCEPGLISFDKVCFWFNLLVHTYSVFRVIYPMRSYFFLNYKP